MAKTLNCFLPSQGYNILPTKAKVVLSICPLINGATVTVTLESLTSCAVFPWVFPLQACFLVGPAHVSVSLSWPELWFWWGPYRRLSPGNNVSAQSRHTLSLQQVSRTLHTAPLLGERKERGREKERLGCLLKVNQICQALSPSSTAERTTSNVN